MTNVNSDAVIIADVTLREYGQNIPASYLYIFTPEIRVEIALRLIPKLIGSRFRVPACPGATGCGYATVFTAYECLTFHHRILTCQPALASGS